MQRNDGRVVFLLYVFGRGKILRLFVFLFLVVFRQLRKTFQSCSFRYRSVADDWRIDLGQRRARSIKPFLP